METLGKLLAAIILVVVGTLVSAYVFVQLWEWFIIPIFGLEPLRIIEAIGLSVFIGFIKAKKADLKAEEDKDFGQLLVDGILYMIFFYGLVLFVGWIVSLFM